MRSRYTNTSSSGCGCFSIALIANLVVILILIVVATMCTATSKTLTIDGEKVNVQTYGFFNEEAQKNDKVIYEASMGSIVFSILLCETVVIPIYLVGYDLYQPIKVRPEHIKALEPPIKDTLGVPVKTFYIK